MAAVAAPPELAQMHIVGGMTGHAVASKLGFARGALVTGIALQARMGPAQREAALLQVVELPDVPGIGTVAALAICTQVAFVDVIGAVAAAAFRRRVLELLRHMATRARYGHVLPEQRECSEVMVEADVPVPRGCGMTVVTGRALRSGMDIDRTVAGHTLLRGLVVRDHCRVAAVAGQGRVRSGQGVLGVLFMVEMRGLPFRGFMTGLALGAHPARVGIRSRMTSRALAWQVVFQPSAAMTGLAGRLPVRTDQRKAGLYFMIKFRVGPGRLGMTVSAGRAALPTVHIIGRVTTGAGRGRCLPAVGSVAGCAGYLRMAGLQRKFRLCVVEVDGGPARRVVTGRAIVAQLSFVRLDPAVAVHTATRCVAEFLPRGMTAGAGHAAMGSVEAEIGCGMIEGGRQHGRYPARSPQVLAMACAALGAGDFRSSTVESAALAQLGGDVLVTGRAKLRLLRPIRAVMAVGAVRFEFGVRAGQRSWHEQAFQGRGARGLAGYVA